MGKGNFVLSSLVTPKESHFKAGWGGTVVWGSVSDTGVLSWSLVSVAVDSLYALALCLLCSVLYLPPSRPDPACTAQRCHRVGTQ